MSITSAISNRSGQRTDRSCVRQRFLRDFQIKTARPAHHGCENKPVNGFDRLGLTNGDVYEIDFFFAERHRTQSNFRIQTNMPIVSMELPTVSVV